MIHSPNPLRDAVAPLAFAPTPPRLLEWVRRLWPVAFAVRALWQLAQLAADWFREARVPESRGRIAIFGDRSAQDHQCAPLTVSKLLLEIKKSAPGNKEVRNGAAFHHCPNRTSGEHNDYSASYNLLCGNDLALDKLMSSL